MTTATKSVGRRLGIITIDQAVSGASNLVIVLLAAHALGVEGLGLFAIVFAVYAFVQGLTRALVADPILVHPVDADQRPGDAIGATTLIGIGFGSLVLAAGLLTALWRPALGAGLMILAVCLPMLVLQDLGRSLGFATRHPLRSLVLDLSWLAMVGVAFAVCFSIGAISLPWFVGAWAGAGAVSGLLVLWQYRVVVPPLGLRLVREKWAFSSRYLMIQLCRESSALLGPVALGATSGASALGAVRAAQIMVRPYMTVEIAVVSAGVAEIARENPELHRLHSYVRRTTTVMTAAGVLNLILLVFLPDALGELALGDTWKVAHPLILAAAVQTVFVALSSGVVVAMFGGRAIKQNVVIDVVTTAVTTACMIAGAIVAGAPGALWGMAVGQAGAAVAWWAAYRRRFSPRGATGGGPPLATLDGPFPSMRGS